MCYNQLFYKHKKTIKVLYPNILAAFHNCTILNIFYKNNRFNSYCYFTSTLLIPSGRQLGGIT